MLVILMVSSLVVFAIFLIIALIVIKTDVLMKDTKTNAFVKIGRGVKQLFLPVLLPLLLMLIFHVTTYFGGGAIQHTYGHYVDNFNLNNKFEDSIPFVIYMVVPYLLYWVYWYYIVFFIYVKCGKRIFYQYITLWIITSVICFLFYITIPFTNNMQWEQDHEQLSKHYSSFFVSIWETIINSTNSRCGMLPSQHVAFTLIPFVALRKKGFKFFSTWFSLFIFIFVMPCVMFLKMHYMLDIVIAIIVVEALDLVLNRHQKLPNWLNTHFTLLNKRIYLES